MIKKLVLVCILCITVVLFSFTFSSTVFAQTNSFNLQSTISGEAFFPLTGDFDADGDQDVLVDVSNGNLNGYRIYFNNGAGNLSNFISFSTTGLFYSAAGDLDNDGDADLVEGTGKVYINNGSGVFTQLPSVILKNGTGSISVVKILDFNQDGKNDVLWGNGSSSVSTDKNEIWVNTGSTGNASFAYFAGFVNQNGGRNSIDAGDIDGDGDLDIVTGSSSNPGQVVKNNGAGNLSSPVIVNGYTGGVRLQDWDQDGDLDYVNFDSYNSYGLRLRRNDGSGNFESPANFNAIILFNHAQTGWNLQGGSNRCTTVDVNGDGFLDAVIDRWGNNARVLINTGCQMVLQSYNLGNSSNGAMVADFNNDGKPDVFCANRYGTESSLWLNDLLPVTTVPLSNITSTTGGTFTPPGSATLSSTASNGGSIRWWNAASGGSIVGNGGTFHTPALNNTTTYYTNSINANGCESERIPVTATAISCVAPTITCPGNITVNNATGQCGANVNFSATATGTSPTITYSQASGSFFNVGTTTVTATATNECGTASCTFNITVKDVEPPVITSQASNLTVQCDGAGNQPDLQAWLDGRGSVPVPGCSNSKFYWSNSPTANGNTATGLINGVGYTYSSSNAVLTSPSIYNYGVFPASYGIPNQTCIRNIYVTNNTLTFNQPMYNPVLVFASIGQSGVSVPIQFSAPVTVLYSQAVVQNSSTKITGTEGYAIVRLNGVYSSISFDYLAQENYVNFAFGADFITPCTSGGANATDQCSGVTWTNNYSGLTAGCGNTGSTTVTWTATDSYGNNSSTTATFSIVDNIAPSIICPANITKNSDPGVCGAIVTFNATANDNCGSPTINYSPASGSLFPPGTTVVTATATDACGNSSTCTFNVNINAPALEGNVTASTYSGGYNVSCHGANDGSATANISGGCLPYSYSWNTSPEQTGQTATGLTAGNYTVNVTDANGTSANYNVTLTEPEQLLASSSSGKILCNGGTTTVTVSANGGTTPYSGTGNYTVGAGTYSYTVTDANGCSSTTSITVTEPTPLSASASAPLASSSVCSFNSGANVIVGYGSNSVTLSGNATGGVGPYTYNWSPSTNLSNPNIANPVFTAGTSTSCNHNYYNLKVTDANGCISYASLDVKVAFVKSTTAKNANKVIICHHAGSNKTIDIEVDASAVPAHLSHGDCLGSCNVNCDVASRNINEVDFTTTNTANETLSIYPNPNTGEFNINFQPVNTDQITKVDIYDAIGKLVFSKTFESENQLLIPINIKGINSSSGLYTVRINNGSESFVKAVIINK